MPSRLPRFLLTLALAYVFLFSGIDKFVRPTLWIGWIPSSLDGVLSLNRAVWLQVFAVIEILLGLLLFVPKVGVQRAAAFLMALYFAAVLTQTGLFTDMGVRDTGLLLAALGLGTWRE